MKHKITATVQWEIDTDASDVVKVASLQLRKMLPNLVSGRILKVDNLKPRRQKKIIGFFDPDEVFPFITSDEERRDYFVDDECFSVRMNSQRYFIFQACPSCVSCGITGNKFVLEQNPNDKSPHFNFYAVNSHSMILMTKDHIHPRSHGGENRHSNYQTMCSVCNNLKGSFNLKIEGLRQIRTAYDENKNNLTKKQLNDLLSEMRHDLQFPINKKKTKEGLYARVDLVVLRKQDKLEIVPVYETGNDQQVACFKKGCSFDQFCKIDGGFEFDFNNEKLFIPDFLAEKT